MAYISLRAYSRHRKCALSAVQKAIDSRRVHGDAIRVDGERVTGIDPVLADQQWAANTDPVEALRNGKLTSAPAAPGGQLDLGAAAGGGDGGERAKASPAAGGGNEEYLLERTKREKFAAANEELEYLAALGRLVPAAEIQEASARRYRAIRDKLLNIPDRIASILAAEQEPVRVHAALTAEIKRVLHELSDDAVAETARGAEERVAA